jgi:Tfp pilus assembly protein PilF
MTLIMTYATPRRIFQSGDFRLTSPRTGEIFDYKAQKQIIVQRFRWTALVGFCGVAHTGREYVPEWIVRQLRALSQDASFEDLLRRLRTAELWLAGANPRFRAITFSVGAFVDFRPTFVLISNFEAIGEPPRAPQTEYSAALQVSRLRPRRNQLLLSGRPSAVTRDDRRWLRNVLGDAAPDRGYAVLAEVNRRASDRDVGVGAACFTSHVTILGDSGGIVHNWPDDQEYLPAFLDVHGMILPRLKAGVDEYGRPKPIQLKGMSGAAFVQSGDYFRVALEEKPTDPSVLSNYGNWLKGRGRLDAAEAAYRAAIASDDGFANAHGNLAILLEDNDHVDTAEKEYRRAVELDGNSVIYAANLAFFLWRRRGDPKGAQTLLQGTLARQRDAFTVGRYALFNDLAFDDRQDAARQLYEEALTIAPQDRWVNGRFADFLRRAGDTAVAREHFELAIAGEQPDIDALVSYGELHLRERSFESAEQLLQRALRFRRRDPAVVAALAATRTLLGAPDADVEPMYRQALEWQPDEPLAAMNLAQILLRLGSGDEEARRLLLAADRADLTPEMRLELLFCGVAYSIEGFDDAVSELGTLLDTGVRVAAWDLSHEIEAARRSGHPHAALLAEVAGT